MTRNLLPIGVALIAGLLAHAQSTPSPTVPTAESTGYRFGGQLGYRTSDGAFIPLVPNAVFIGWGDGGCEPARQLSARLGVYPDGTFTLSVSEEMTRILHIHPDGSVEPSSSVNIRWPCYRFQVEGCDDAIVQFGPKPPSPSIELNCPGRETTPRRDG